MEALKQAVIAGGGWTEEHIAEMKSIADATAFSEDDVQMANLFYEFGTLGGASGRKSDGAPSWPPQQSPIGCTSIVAQAANGTIVHARNQDYSLPGLSNITVQLEFTRSGRVVYRGNTFASYIGLPTAMVPGGWSVSCDSRFDAGGWNLMDNVRAARAGAKTIGIFVRQMLETAPSYHDAIAMLNSTSLIAPAYYIVGGSAPGEGAVVTRSRDAPDDESHGEGIWSIGDGTTPSAREWWRLETNFDHWGVAKDGRRSAANKMMAGIGQSDVDLQRLFHLLSTPPVLASDTVYTALMWPHTGSYTTVIREH